MARYFGGIRAPHILVDALPLGYPRLAWLREDNEALEDLRGAAVDLIWRALKMEKFFAVRAALFSEALLRAKSSATRLFKVRITTEPDGEAIWEMTHS